MWSDRTLKTWSDQGSRRPQVDAKSVHGVFVGVDAALFQHLQEVFLAWLAEGESVQREVPLELLVSGAVSAEEVR